MKNLFLFIFITSLLFSCGNSNQSNEEKSSELVSINMNELYANVDDFVDQELSVSGLVTHVCKHGGQKLFIIGESNEQRLRINVGKEIPEFSLEMEGSTVEFTGILSLMDDELLAETIVEHEDHHAGEETEAQADCETEKDTINGESHNAEYAPTEKEYFLTASKFIIK